MKASKYNYSCCLEFAWFSSSWNAKPTIFSTLTPSPSFLVYSGRLAEWGSFHPSSSLHWDTFGEVLLSSWTLALLCLLYTPKNKPTKAALKPLWPRPANETNKLHSWASLCGRFYRLTDTFSNSSSTAFLSRRDLSIWDALSAHSYKEEERRKRGEWE